MKQVINQWKNSDFFGVLRIIMLSTVASLFLFECVAASVLVPALKKQAISVAEASFYEAETEMKLLVDSAKKTAIKVLLDSELNALINATNMEMLDSTTIYRSLRHLKLYKTTDDYVESVYILNKRVGYLFATESTQVYSDISAYPNLEFLEYYEDRANMRQMKKHTILEEVSPQMVMTPVNVYTYALPSRYSGDSVESAVIVNMSLESLLKTYSQYYIQNNMYIGLADASDVLIEANAINSEHNGIFREWWNDLIEREIFDDTRIIDGTIYSLIRFDFDELGIQYVMIRPLSDIYEMPLRISKMILIVTCGVLACGLFISFIASNAVQRIFHAMMLEREELKKAAQNNLKHRQMNFWEKYISGQTHYTIGYLMSQMEALQLGGEHQGSLVMLCMDLPQRQQDDLMPEYIVDIWLKTFEDVSPQYLFHAKNCFVFLHRTNGEHVYLRLQKGIDGLRQKLPYDFNVLGNDEVYQIEQFPIVWEELKLGEKLLFFYPYNTCLNYQQIAKEHKNTENCSHLDILKQLSEHSIRGDMTGATEVLDAFFQRIENNSLESWYHHLAWLCMSLTNEAAFRCKSLNTIEQPSYEILLRDLYRCTRHTEAETMVREYMERLMYLTPPATGKNALGGRIHEIQEYVVLNCRDETLSVEQIAEHFDYAPDYLRKTYRSITGQSISDYIMQVRLEKATEQMKKSRDTIKNIAVSCGFSNINYFYTCFKKKYGVSPTTFRSNLHTAQQESNGNDTETM